MIHHRWSMESQGMTSVKCDEYLADICRKPNNQSLHSMQQRHSLTSNHHTCLFFSHLCWWTRTILLLLPPTHGRLHPNRNAEHSWWGEVEVIKGLTAVLYDWHGETFWWSQCEGGDWPSLYTTQWRRFTNAASNCDTNNRHPTTPVLLVRGAVMGGKVVSACVCVCVSVRDCVCVWDSGIEYHAP